MTRDGAAVWYNVFGSAQRGGGISHHNLVVSSGQLRIAFCPVLSEDLAARAKERSKRFEGAELCGGLRGLVFYCLGDAE